MLVVNRLLTSKQQYTLNFTKLIFVFPIQSVLLIVLPWCSIISILVIIAFNGMQQALLFHKLGDTCHRNDE
jgi:hypothetical protein